MSIQLVNSRLVSKSVYLAMRPVRSYRLHARIFYLQIIGYNNYYVLSFYCRKSVYLAVINLEIIIKQYD